MRLAALGAEGLAGQRPPLSCRTSPPRGGRSADRPAFANRWRGRTSGDGEAADLPPRGGDVRQDRGGQRRALSLRRSVLYDLQGAGG